MNTLESLQQNFFDSIFQEKTVQPTFISSSCPTERVAIHRRTILHTLYKALALTFPGIWMLLGENCANHVAELFCNDRNNLPKDACLDDWGSQFPRFLSQQPALSHLPYLQDYAEYEWLKHCCFCAPYLPSLRLADLQLTSETDLETLRLSFSPCVFLCYSVYPLNKIEALIENPNGDAININSNKSYALITRKNNAIHTEWIGAEIYCFIEALQNNNTLGQAFIITQKKYPQFDLTESLQLLTQSSISCELLQNFFN